MNALLGSLLLLLTALSAVGLGVFLTFATVTVLLNSMGQRTTPRLVTPISSATLVQTHASGD
ncbi:MAG TPA: hypothetical protein VFA89_08600 [Terriglobales bacterium]|nr:hypothetical protein [Terriglobales bacterium]